MRAMTARLATPDDDTTIAQIVESLRTSVTHDGAPPFDPAEFTQHPTNFALMVRGGCFLARAVEQGSYTIHTNFLPNARGANALRESREALAYAFLATPAEQLLTMVPEANLPAMWFAHSMGFENTWRQPGAWVKDGTRSDLQHMRLDVDDWVRADALCKATGKEFHDGLGEDLSHAPDTVHDAYVGAAVLMVASQQPDKAVRIYGRWARTAGYQPAAIVTREPLVLDIGTHLAHVHGAEYTLEKKTCPQP